MDNQVLATFILAVVGALAGIAVALKGRWRWALIIVCIVLVLVAIGAFFFDQIKIDGTEAHGVDTITVNSADDNGEQLQAYMAGTYVFTYTDGAYAQGPPANFPPGSSPWLTGVIIFDGDKPSFDGRDDLGRPSTYRAPSLGTVADTGYNPTASAAKATALKAPSLKLNLAAGQTITLICFEARNYFYDNTGSVTIKLSYLG